MVELRLKEILKEKNISRYKLQFLTQINYPRVNQLYKNNAKNISFEEIEKLINALDCSITDLFKESA